MVKPWITGLICILLAVLCACTAGSTVESEYGSVLYTDREIQAAIDTATAYFNDHFSGCTLTEITYGGDERTKAHVEWAQRHNADEVIVLISSFDVAATGADGSLNPNSTYTDWMWILVREDGGNWYHVDHGY